MQTDAMTEDGIVTEDLAGIGGRRKSPGEDVVIAIVSANVSAISSKIVGDHEGIEKTLLVVEAEAVVEVEAEVKNGRRARARLRKRRSLRLI